MKCDSCGKEIEKGTTYCPYCGSKTNAVKKRLCPNCLTELSEDMAFCPDCGARMTINARPTLPPRTKGKISVFSSLLAVLPGAEIAAMALLIPFKSSLFFPVLLGFTVVEILLSCMRKRCVHQCNACLYEDAEQYPHKYTKNPPDVNRAEKEINGYFSKQILLNIAGCVVMILGLLLFFVPFFSMIFKEVSIFSLTESAMLWNVFRTDSAERFNYHEILLSIISECSFVSLIDGFGADIVLAISMLMFLGASFVAPVYMMILNFTRQYMFRNNEQYKKSILFVYAYQSEGEVQLASKFMLPRMIVYILVFVLMLPFVDFLLTLPKYFQHLTGSTYQLVLFAYFAAVIFVYVRMFLASYRTTDRRIACSLNKKL